ncbi:MAG: hypothetical protein MH472_03505 [Bacteroidia bacterium]|nr:hypothetical protein [Bacteroidia bacterium]
MRKTDKGTRFKTLISKADYALETEFFLEASAICYAVIEERLRSILIKTLNREIGEKHKIDSCVKQIKKLRRTEPLIAKYYTVDFMNEINLWKNERNDITHELIEYEVDEIKLEQNAKKGRKILRVLNATIMRWKKEFKSNCA